MYVYLYDANIKINQINKQIGTATNVNCIIKDNLDVLNPVFELDFNASILSKNYMYVPDLGRYYFITNIEIINHTIIIRGHVDVLKTYATDIMNARGIATRSQYYNRNLADKMVVTLESEKIRYRVLSSAITGGTYVAIIGGK